MRAHRQFVQARMSSLWDDSRLFGSISVVALMIVLAAAVNGWKVEETMNVVSGGTTSSVPCAELDRWAPRKTDRHQFIACVASVVGLHDYSFENVDIQNGWLRKHGQVLVFRHTKESSECYAVTDVWYLDRTTMKVLKSDTEHLVC